MISIFSMEKSLNNAYSIHVFTMDKVNCKIALASHIHIQFDIQDVSLDDGQMKNKLSPVSILIILKFSSNHPFLCFTRLTLLLLHCFTAAAAFHPMLPVHFRQILLMFKSCTCNIKHGDKWEFMWKLCQQPENGQVKSEGERSKVQNSSSTQLHNNFIIFLCSTRLGSKKFITSKLLLHIPNSP